MDSNFQPIKCKLIEYYFTERNKTIKKRKCSRIPLDTVLVISKSIHHSSSIDFYYGGDSCSSYWLKDEEFKIESNKVILTHHIPTGSEYPKYETFIFEILEDQQFNTDGNGWITF